MPSNAGTVRIGKAVFAAGLFWQAAPSVAAAGREARIIAAKAELGADLFCVRRRGMPQFGLGQRRAGHRPGMRAVAASLANAIPEPNWMGVFVTERGWFLAMVRKGAVMPDGDLLLPTEAEARVRFRDELAGGGWDTVFAPAAWQVPDTRSEGLAALVRRKADGRLRAVVWSPWHPVIAGVGLVAAGLAAWGLIGNSAHQGQVAVPEVPVVPPPPPPPWLGKADVRSFILACQLGIESVRTVPGYELDIVSCGPSGTRATYRRQGGTLSWLPEGGGVASPDRLTLSAPLAARVELRRGEENPWTAERLRRRIWGAAQDYLLDSELTEAPAGAAPPGAAGQAASSLAFREVSISLASRLPPSALTGLLGAVPAFVPEEVTWQAMRWKVKGKAYVR